MKQIILILCIIFTLHSNKSLSQVKVAKSPLSKTALIELGVKQSNVILEVYLISIKSFKTKTSIYTSGTYKVLKVFEGNLTDSLIEVIYDGGTVDGESVSSSESGGSIEHEGILFLKDKTDIKLNKDLQAYFPSINIDYDIKTHQAHCGRTIFEDIVKDLYEPIEALTGQKRKVLGKNMFGF